MGGVEEPNFAPGRVAVYRQCSDQRCSLGAVEHVLREENVL